jgi:hypothetical protein
MTYKDSDTMEDVCAYERNATAFFEKTLVFPCDQQTHTAKVDVFVLLDTIGTLAGHDSVANSDAVK